MSTTADLRRQPPGVLTLAMVEMWERFSFYGMLSLLVLFLIQPEDGPFPPGPGQGFSEVDAAALSGSYSALILAAPLIGGWIGDRMIGPRRALLVGGILIAAGHFILLSPGLPVFWFGLVVIAAGTGLLKPNISAVLGALYEKGDPRRDSGFSMFYLGINAGAFTAPLICGWLATAYSWRLAFSVAGFGMLIGLTQYLLGVRRLGEAGLTVPRPAEPRERRRILGTAAGSVAVIAVTLTLAIDFLGFNAGVVSGAVTIIIVCASVIVFTSLLRRTRSRPLDNRHLRGFLLIFIATALYSTLSSQAGSTITEFTQHWIDRQIGSFTMPTSWLLSLNPILVVILAPVFAILWTRLGDRAPTTPTKIAFALVGVGLSFLVMAVPGYRAEGGLTSSALWILATFLVLTCAELLLVPIALSATTELAPVGLTSQLLGLWYLASAAGGSIGGQLVRLAEVVGIGAYFVILGLAAMVVGVAFVWMRPALGNLLAPVR